MEEKLAKNVDKTLRNPYNFNPLTSIITNGIYAPYLKIWFENFPKDNFLILDGHDIIKNPYLIMKEAEKFMGLKNFINPWNFWMNNQTGFYCPRESLDSEPQCLKNGKGILKLVEVKNSCSDLK